MRTEMSQPSSSSTHKKCQTSHASDPSMIHNLHGLGDSNNSLHSTFSVHSPLSSRKAASAASSSQYHPVSPHPEEEQSEDDESAAAATATVPTSSRSLASRKVVSFDEMVRVRETLHINDFSVEEYSRCWITNDEQQVIHSMADITTELMVMGMVEDDGIGICYRGLECKTQRAKGVL